MRFRMLQSHIDRCSVRSSSADSDKMNQETTLSGEARAAPMSECDLVAHFQRLFVQAQGLKFGVSYFVSTATIKRNGKCVRRCFGRTPRFLFTQM